MTVTRWNLAAIAISLSLTAPAFAETGTKKPADFTKTERAPFAPGGTIRIDHTYGELSIEGWDRAEVEMTVTKIPNDLYDTDEPGHAEKQANHVSVAFQRKSDTEIDVSTAVEHFNRLTHPFGPKGHTAMEYRLFVPRHSKLVIHHGNGEVMISGVVGDIDASSNAGDIALLLPQTEKYSIDAKSSFGTTWCDFDGKHHQSWMKTAFSADAPAGAHKITVRIGRGGIQIKGSPSEAQPPASR
jgi:hypothetical protein